MAFFLFFKQKTAYEMRISDWSSDVCSSDLAGHRVAPNRDDVAAGLHQFEVEFGQVLERAVLAAGVAEAVDVLGESAAAGLAGQRKPALEVVAGHRRARGLRVVGVVEQHAGVGAVHQRGEAELAAGHVAVAGQRIEIERKSQLLNSSN